MFFSCGALVRSFSIYSSAELLSFKFKRDGDKNELKKPLQRVLFGIFIDAIVLRNFHKRIDSTRLSSVAKTFVEQSVIAPLISTTYLILHNNLSHDTLKTLYVSDICFWTPISYVGYELVSTKKRFVYTGICSVCWATFRIANFT